MGFLNTTEFKVERIKIFATGILVYIIYIPYDIDEQLKI